MNEQKPDQLAKDLFALGVEKAKAIRAKRSGKHQYRVEEILFTFDIEEDDYIDICTVETKSGDDIFGWLVNNGFCFEEIKNKILAKMKADYEPHIDDSSPSKQDLDRAAVDAENNHFDLNH